MISVEEIQAAAKRIQGFAYRTPCCRSFSKEGVWLKLECYQPIRAFKIRGAANRMLSIPQNELKKRGVITASSGNHGLAVAYMAMRLKVDATIVLPDNVVPDKLEMISSLGGRTIFAGRQQDERARKADEIMRAEGQIFIQPFNDPEIIAGQGTCGLEIIEDLPNVQSIFVPIGGGGLISGVASVVKQNKETEHVRLIGVQSEGSPSMYKSFKAGKLSKIEASNTIADGLAVRQPGDITFSIVQKLVDDIILVSDEEILSATYDLLRREHVLAEPSGGAALAGLVKFKRQATSKAEEESVAIVSGGNISQQVLLEKVIDDRREG